MTGPGPGKIPLSCSVELVLDGKKIAVEAEVYIHVKGWSRALVTHIDVESPDMNIYIARPSTGFYAKHTYSGKRLYISLDRALKKCVLVISEEAVFPKVFSEGESSWCFVGGKYGGIYIGFRKAYIERLERIAKEVFGVEPRKKRHLD